jgi:hypothetical protein
MKITAYLLLLLVAGTNGLKCMYTGPGGTASSYDCSAVTGADVCIYYKFGTPAKAMQICGNELTAKGMVDPSAKAVYVDACYCKTDDCNVAGCGKSGTSGSPAAHSLPLAATMAAVCAVAFAAFA